MNARIRHPGSVAVAVAMILAAAVSSRAQAQQSPSSDSQAQRSSNSSSQAPALEEVTVTGIRESILKAQDLKRYAPSNIEAITLEDLGKFADTKISDALERVPGVAIEHNSFGLDAIDGVTIRGLGPDYLITTVNGRDQLGEPGFFGGYGGNPNSGGRDFDYASVPPDILAAVTVYKAPTSSLVESGLAGEVDLKTLRPLDYKGHGTGRFFGTLNASEVYEPNARRGGPHFNGIFGAKLLDGTLGLLVSGVYSNEYNNTRRIQEYQGLHDVTLGRPDGSTYVQKNVGTTDGFSPSVSNQEFDRRSVTAAVQWKPSDQLEVNLDGEYNQFTAINQYIGGDMYTGFNFFSNAVEGGPPVFPAGSYTIRGNQMVGFNDSMVVPPPGAPPYDSTGMSYLNALEPNQFWNAGLNAVWHINSGNSLEFDFGHSYGSYLDYWRDPGTGANPTDGINVIFDGSGKYPAVTVLQQPGTNISDPADYGQGGVGLFVFQDLTRQKRDQFRLDLTSQLTDHFTLKVGARHQQTTYKTVLGYGPYANPLTLTPAMIGPSHQWYGYNVAVPSINYGAVCAQLAYYCTVSNLGYGSFGGWGLPSNPNGDPADKYAFQGPQSGRLYETNTAFYTQVNGDGELFGLESSGNVGVRAVRMGEHGLAYQGTTYVLSSGGGPDPKNDPYNTSTPFADQFSYWEILPTANFTVKPRHNMNVRFGVAKTMSLPEYPALIPNVSLQIETPYSNGVVTPSILSAGNLHLKPMTAWNYDFTVEYYTERQAAYIGSLFYKDVKDLTTTVTNINAPIPSQYQSLVPNGPLPSGYTPPRSGFTVMLPVNANYGQTYGAELGTNQPFTFLPSPWDGFGLQANYTYVASKLHIYGDPNPTAFPGSSKHNVNATFYYDKYGWDARIAYSYRNDYLSSVATHDQSTYTYAYTTLDASISKEIGQHLEVMLTASNITESPIINYIGSGRMFANYFERPRTYTLGIRGKF